MLEFVSTFVGALIGSLIGSYIGGRVAMWVNWSREQKARLRQKARGY